MTKYRDKKYKATVQLELGIEADNLKDAKALAKRYDGEVSRLGCEGFLERAGKFKLVKVEEKKNG